MPASQEIASKADANLANALVQILPRLLVEWGVFSFIFFGWIHRFFFLYPFESSFFFKSIRPTEKKIY